MMEGSFISTCGRSDVEIMYKIGYKITNDKPKIIQYMQFRYFDIFGLFNAVMGDSLTLTNTNFAMYIPALFCNGIRAGLFIYLFRQFFRGLPNARGLF